MTSANRDAERRELVIAERELGVSSAQPPYRVNVVVKKILILTANPRNTDKLRLDEEVREIQAGLKRAKRRDDFEIVTQWALRVNDLRQALLDNDPSIVHFSGHGAGEQGLALENDSGQMQLVSTASLAKLFKLFKDKIECVVFNACYSEAQAEAIFQHIDCVVGMNKAIGDRAAIKFAVGFYEALGAGRSYADAYEFGCNAIDLEGIPESLTPAIKNRTEVEPSSDSKNSRERESNPDNQTPFSSGSTNISQGAGDNAKQIGQIGSAGNITL